MQLISSKEAAVAPVTDFIGRLNTNGEAGLTRTEVDARQQMYGYNEMKIHKEEPLWLKYINQVSVCFILTSCITLSCV